MNWTKFTKLMFAFGALLNGVAFTPLAALDQDCEPLWYLDGEFLWLEAKEDGLDYVRYFENTLAPTSIKSISPHQKCNPGFRVAAGYTSGDKAWYSDLIWTHYENRARSRYNKSPLPDGTPFVIQTRDLLNTSVPITVTSFEGDADWKLNYDVVDVEVGVPCCINGSFVVTPFIGARGFFTREYFNSDVTIPGAIHSERANCDFYGGGGRAGVNLLWNVGSGFAFYGKAAGSLVYGRFSISGTEINQLEHPFLTFSNHRDRVRPNLEGGMGVQLTFDVARQKRCTISVGYEAIQWFDQNQFPGAITTLTTRSSSLCLQGIRGAIQVAF